MSKDFSGALEKLGQSSQVKPSKLVERHLDNIEKALEEGAIHEKIYKTLQDEGLKLTYGGYLSALFRARKRRLGTIKPTPLPQATADKKTNQFVYTGTKAENMKNLV